MATTSKQTFKTKADALAALGTSKGRADVLTQSIAEDRAVKTATAAGKPVPATPAIDALNERGETAQAAPAKRSRARGESKPKVEIHYFHDGKPASRDVLSFCAWAYTAGIDGDAPRVTVARLTEILAEQGVQEPTTESFDVTLPNGVVLSARVAGDRKALPKPAAKPAAAKKATATKRQPAKRGAAAKRPAAAVKSTTRAKRDVTPIPKSGTKRTGTRKAAAKR